MTGTQLEALKYLRNSNGGATKDNFVDDFDPIGGLLWDFLEENGLVVVKEDRIFPSDAGNLILNEEDKTAEEKKKKRRIVAFQVSESTFEKIRLIKRTHSIGFMSNIFRSSLEKALKDLPPVSFLPQKEE